MNQSLVPIDSTQIVVPMHRVFLSEMMWTCSTCPSGQFWLRGDGAVVCMHCMQIHQKLRVYDAAGAN